MMLFLSFTLAVLLHLPALALVSTGVIFPLVIYPSRVWGDNCTNWIPVNQAISENPQVPFLIIFDPAIGAGSLNSQPDSTYQRCIPQLLATGSAAGGNVRIMGLVETGSGTLDSNLVTNNISTYAQWDAAYRPTGIFFNGVTASTDLASLYKSYADDVRNSFGSNAFVTLNAGQNPETTAYYEFSDLIVSVEQFYNKFSASDLSITSASPANKQSVIIHDGPSTTPTNLVSQLISLGIKYIFITDFSNAVEFQNIPSDWADFVHTVATTTRSGNTTANGGAATGNGGNTAGNSGNITGNGGNIAGNGGNGGNVTSNGGNATSNGGNTSGNGGNIAGNGGNVTSNGGNTTSNGGNTSGNGGNTTGNGGTGNGGNTTGGNTTGDGGDTTGAGSGGNNGGLNGSTSSSKVAPIVGGVVGGLAFIALIAALIFIKRRKQRQTPEAFIPFMTQTTSAAQQPTSAVQLPNTITASSEIAPSSVLVGRQEKQQRENPINETSTMSNSMQARSGSISVSQQTLSGGENRSWWNQLSTSELVRLLHERLQTSIDEEMPPEYTH